MHLFNLFLLAATTTKTFALVARVPPGLASTDLIVHNSFAIDERDLEKRFPAKCVFNMVACLAGYHLVGYVYGKTPISKKAYGYWLTCGGLAVAQGVCNNDEPQKMWQNLDAKGLVSGANLCLAIGCTEDADCDESLGCECNLVRLTCVEAWGAT
ncbi:hypothetical protein EJ08DRAFT_13477 [Tothia fuscella]|uniref:Uncharacterized protein n=1 Tax=Tothia fuscella TaxID=1048955 RepID=A0A9P4U4X0_9PEZI|nr:hypothetical protein EJ08DRAFT_13477 [Tothia fuscella]